MKRYDLVIKSKVISQMKMDCSFRSMNTQNMNWIHPNMDGWMDGCMVSIFDQKLVYQNLVDMCLE